MKKMFVILGFTGLLTSCYTTQHLHQTGTYTVKERNGNITEFYGVKGKYEIVSDTLKKNDRIIINVIQAHR